MNEFRAFAKETASGWIAMVRRPHDGEPKPVRDASKRAIVFPDELAAHRAATQSLETWLNGNMRRHGETLCAAKRAAEALFNGTTIYPGHGRAAVVVEHRHRRRA